MNDLKKEYRQAFDRLEPDSRLLELLKADMKTAADAPSKPNFFVRYGWVFGSAAACIAVVLAVSVFFALGDMGASGGSMNNDQAYNAGAAPEMAEDATYGLNGDANAADGGAMDEPDEADGSFVPTTDERTAENAVTTTSLTPGEALTDDYYLMTAIEPQQVEALEPLSYEQLKGLVMIEQSESNLIFTDFLMLDFIDWIDGNGYYLVLRYDRDGFSLPVVAAFPGVPSFDTVMSSLRVYLGYNQADGYIDLKQMSMEDFVYYFAPAEYVYSFGDDYVYFGEKDLDRLLTPLNDEQFFALVNKAERGALTLLDFYELERFGVGYSIYAQTLVCTYTDEVTGQGYALIAHFVSGEEDAAPDQLILRKRNSLKELDLLRDYDTLGRFLGSF